MIPPDQRKIEKYSRYLIRGLGPKAHSRSYEDLLSEAMVSIFEGATSTVAGRRWPLGVTFVKFVCECMRSIASHWKAAKFDAVTVVETDLIVETSEGLSKSPLSEKPSTATSPECSAVVSDELRRVMSLFADDHEASTVIEAWGLGFEGSEIEGAFGITSKRFDTVKKRIRYQVKADKIG